MFFKIQKMCTNSHKFLYLDFLFGSVMIIEYEFGSLMVLKLDLPILIVLVVLFSEEILSKEKVSVLKKETCHK